MNKSEASDHVENIIAALKSKGAKTRLDSATSYALIFGPISFQLWIACDDDEQSKARVVLQSIVFDGGRDRSAERARTPVIIWCGERRDVTDWAPIDITNYVGSSGHRGR